MAQDMKTVVQELLKENDAVVFDKDNCGECRKTEALMTELGIRFATINMSKDKEALAKVKNDGFREAPAIYTRDDQWSGHKSDKVNGLAESLGISVGSSSADDEDDDTWDF